RRDGTRDRSERRGGKRKANRAHTHGENRSAGDQEPAILRGNSLQRSSPVRRHNATFRNQNLSVLPLTSDRLLSNLRNRVSQSRSIRTPTRCSQLCRSSASAGAWGSSKAE